MEAGADYIVADEEGRKRGQTEGRQRGFIYNLDHRERTSNLVIEVGLLPNSGCLNSVCLVYLLGDSWQWCDLFPGPIRDYRFWLL